MNSNSDRILREMEDLDQYSETTVDIPFVGSYNVPAPSYNVSVVYKFFFIKGTYRTGPQTIFNPINYHNVNIKLAIAPNETNGLVLTPDLNSINLDGTPSGTKGVSSAMKAFVTNT